MTMTSQFTVMTPLSIFFDVDLFLLSSLVTGPSFMLSEFCLISGDLNQLRIENLTQMFLMKCCEMPELKLLPFLSY